MSKKFAVFDLDGTLIRWQLYHATADALVRLGYIKPAAYQVVKDARMSWKKRLHDESFGDYESRLVEAFDKMITNLKVSEFNEAIESVFNEYKDQVYTYTRNLITELKAKNYLLFAISGSQIEIAGKIAAYYGFNDCVGSQYVQSEGKFTGKKILTIGSKHLILKDLATKHSVTYEDSIAVGDSEGDISMLEAVEMPIVFNPTKGLFARAKQKGWTVVIERKNMIYNLKRDNGKYVLA